MTTKAKAIDPSALAREHEREAKADEVDIAIRITDGDKVWILRQSQLGPADDRIARQQYGYPIMGVFSALGSGQSMNVGTDLIIALLWMAERKSTVKRSLSYAQVEARFPTYAGCLDLEIEPFDANTGLPLGPDGKPLADSEVLVDPEA